MTRPLPGWTKPTRRVLADRLENLIGPRFPARPACAGRSPGWDLDVWGEPSEQRDDRHRSAIAVCRQCPALVACTTLLPDLPPDTTGVWAGQLLDGRRRAECRARTSIDLMDAGPAGGPMAPTPSGA